MMKLLLSISKVSSVVGEREMHLALSPWYWSFSSFLPSFLFPLCSRSNLLHRYKCPHLTLVLLLRSPLLTSTSPSSLIKWSQPWSCGHVCTQSSGAGQLNQPLAAYAETHKSLRFKFTPHKCSLAQEWAIGAMEGQCGGRFNVGWPFYLRLWKTCTHTGSSVRGLIFATKKLMNKQRSPLVG